MAQVPKAQLATIHISVINQSTVLSDEQVSPVVAALQKQVTNDFRPAWGVDAELEFVPSGAQPPAGSWWLSILDDSDQANALGYHDLTTDGLPIGKVFAGTDLKVGASWSVTASHELLEMLADPNINLTVFVQNADTTGRLYAYEACDACEADNLGYQVDNILLSDFVFPSWFEGFRAHGSTQFAQTGHIQGPLELLPGGYICIFDVSAGPGWHQMTAEKRPVSMAQRGNVGSRRERRRLPREQWLVSVPHREITRRAADYRQRLDALQTQAA